MRLILGNRTKNAMKNVIIVLYLDLLFASYALSKIELVNNGYGGISIIIKETVPEDAEILSKLQSIFTRASAKLFKATKNTVYFRDITVVIPKSWTPKSEYTDISRYSSSGSYILVDNPRGGVDNTPYTQEGSGCGSEGQYIHLTPNFLLSGDDEYGPQENVIVHEWGHLRWGLMDEAASVARPDGVLWSFYLEDGAWVPVRCTDQITGDIRKDCADATTECSTKANYLLDTQGCKFCVNDGGGAKASLMGFQYIKSLDGFCDDMEDANVPPEYKHNRKAINLQNTQCDRKSAWEVMRQHSDFNVSNLQLPDGTDTQPTFQLVQEKDKTRILILDVSGSMSGDRLERMREASEIIIRTLLQKDSWLAIVSFESIAYTLAEFKRIISDADRDHFVNALPSGTLGSTSIGAGLKLALQMINSSGLACRESEFILITDGEENTPPFIADVTQDIVHCGLVVTTIGITQNADDKIKELAEATNGKRFTYLETSALTFVEILTEVVTTSGALADSTDPVEILSRLTGSSTSGTFVIDSGLGNDTKLTIDFSGNADANIVVTGPNGFSHQLNVQGSNVAIASLSGTLEAGRYNYSIQSTNTGDAHVYVTSAPRSVDAAVIRVTSYFNQTNVQFDGNSSLKLFADVMKGTLPVINAEVLAVIQTPTGEEIELKLEDNGLEPDFRQNDGKYACFILPKYFDSNGEYTTKIVVSDTEDTMVSLLARGSNAQIPAGSDPVQIEEDVDSFERVSVAEELTVNNYFVVTEDFIPPARITDLQVTDIYTVTDGKTEQREFTIYWTAVGDDMNIGNASKYDMRISETFADLDKNFESAPAATFNFSDPNPAGFNETLLVTISTESTYDSTLYVAIRAIDSSGNKGAMSNIIAVTVPFNYETTAKLTFSQSGSRIFVSDSNADELIGPVDAYELSIAVLAGAVTSSIVAVVLVVIFVICKVKYKPVDPFLRKFRKVKRRDHTANKKFSDKRTLSPNILDKGLEAEHYAQKNSAFEETDICPYTIEQSFSAEASPDCVLVSESEVIESKAKGLPDQKINSSPSGSFIDVKPYTDTLIPELDNPITLLRDEYTAVFNQEAKTKSNTSKNWEVLHDSVSATGKEKCQEVVEVELLTLSRNASRGDVNSKPILQIPRT